MVQVTNGLTCHLEFLFGMEFNGAEFPEYNRRSLGSHKCFRTSFDMIMSEKESWMLTLNDRRIGDIWFVDWFIPFIPESM